MKKNSRQWVINTFERRIFPLSSVNVFDDDDDDDDDDHYIYNDELCHKGTLTPRTPVTPPIIQDPPARGSTQEKRSKIYPQNKCCRDCWYCSYKYMLGTLMKIFPMK